MQKFGIAFWKGYTPKQSPLSFPAKARGVKGFLKRFNEGILRKENKNPGSLGATSRG
jgi:hypothetical protein